MKMSALEYYSLPTVRKMRRMIRTQARKWTITIDNKGNRKSKDGMKAKLKILDNKGGDILKVRIYKGMILCCIRKKEVNNSYGKSI